MQILRDKLIIFFTALLLRGFLGYIFYGSVDVSAYIGIGKHTFDNTLIQCPHLAYNLFPVISFYLWFSSLLSALTALPVAFCFKLIPIVCDSVLAVLLYDIVKRYQPNYAFFTGFLYAISPVALMVTCIHGQWDAVPIFFFLLGFYIRECFVDSILKYLLYGVCFALSFLIKPVSLIFVPFFFVPYANFTQIIGVGWRFLQALAALCLSFVVGGFLFFKLSPKNSMADMLHVLKANSLQVIIPLVLLAMLMVLLLYRFLQCGWTTCRTYVANQLVAVAGCALAVVIAFGFFYWYGFNLFIMIDRVLRYLNQGVTIFGLPYAYPFNQWPLSLILKNRFWIMIPISYIALRYYQAKLSIFNAMIVTLAVVFCCAGLSPQYFLWLLPLLLIGGYYRIVAIYNTIFAFFCLLYYMNPWTNLEVLYQSMLSFAPLKNFSWLTPPQLLTEQSLITIVRVIGNYLIPLLCLAIAWYVFFASYNQSPLMYGHFKVLRNWYLSLHLAFVLSTIILMIFYPVSTLFYVLDYRIAHRFDGYDTMMIGPFLSGNYGAIKPCNIIFLFTLLTIVAGVYAWRQGAVLKGAGDDKYYF